MDTDLKQEYRREYLICPEPDCGGTLVTGGGCSFCPWCGWSKCK
jgi:hypothetical protein